MIIETTDEDYRALIQERAPRGFALPDSAIAPVEVLQMLAGVAEQVRRSFSPVSWLIIDRHEVVGMCSVTKAPMSGVVDIGYGIAPSRQGRGIASVAVAEIALWARRRADVAALTAETGTANTASQRVLLRSGFAQTGTRIDAEEGPLICWRLETL